jgi:hypothetical protein
VDDAAVRLLFGRPTTDLRVLENSVKAIELLLALQRSLIELPYRKVPTVLSFIKRTPTGASGGLGGGSDDDDDNGGGGAGGGKERDTRAGLTEAWRGCLTVMPGVSADKARAIVSEFPTYSALASQLVLPPPHGGPGMLTTKMGSGRNDTKLSHRLHALFTTRDGNEII